MRTLCLPLNIHALYMNENHDMKVLIVEDNDLLQARLRNALIKIDGDMVISQAGSCKEALELFSYHVPDTVILDIALPDGSGIDLLRTFKKDYPPVSVLMFTNYPTDEFKKSCMEMGADQFFDKANMNELIKTIK